MYGSIQCDESVYFDDSTHLDVSSIGDSIVARCFGTRLAVESPN